MSSCMMDTKRLPQVESNLPLKGTPQKRSSGGHAGVNAMSYCNELIQQAELIHQADLHDTIYHGASRPVSTAIGHRPGRIGQGQSQDTRITNTPEYTQCKRAEARARRQHQIFWVSSSRLLKAIAQRSTKLLPPPQAFGALPRAIAA